MQCGENENGSFFDAKTKNMILDVCIWTPTDRVSDWMKERFLSLSALFLHRQKHRHSNIASTRLHCLTRAPSTEREGDWPLSKGKYCPNTSKNDVRKSRETSPAREHLKCFVCFLLWFPLRQFMCDRTNRLRKSMKHTFYSIGRVNSLSFSEQVRCRLDSRLFSSHPNDIVQSCWSSSRPMKSSCQETSRHVNFMSSFFFFSSVRTKEKEHHRRWKATPFEKRRKGGTGKGEKIELRRLR